MGDAHCAAYAWQLAVVIDEAGTAEPRVAVDAVALLRAACAELDAELVCCAAAVAWRGADSASDALGALAGVTFCVGRAAAAGRPGAGLRVCALSPEPAARAGVANVGEGVGVRG